MKIYFYDGNLMNIFGMRIGNGDTVPFVIDASNGPRKNIKDFERLRNNKNKDDIIVLTNSLVGLSTQYGWNFKENHIDIFIYIDDTEEFVRIDELADREIRVEHNIEKMYLSGVFDC